MLEKIGRYFSIDFHDYERTGGGIIITSGFGLGLALMDVMTDSRWLLDIDNYRDKLIDWEVVGALLDFSGVNYLALVGWYTIDSPSAMQQLKRGLIKTPVLEYIGGENSLANFLETYQQYLRGGIVKVDC